MPDLVPRTLALRLSHGDAFFIHQVAVDAYAAQHAGPASKTITIAFALIGLCLLLERGYTGKAVQRAHMHSPTDRSVGLRLTRRYSEEVSPSQTFSVPCRAARGTRQLCSGQHRCGRLGSRRIRLSAHSSPGTRNDNGITQAAFLGGEFSGLRLPLTHGLERTPMFCHLGEAKDILNSISPSPPGRFTSRTDAERAIPSWRT